MLWSIAGDLACTLIAHIIVLAREKALAIRPSSDLARPNKNSDYAFGIYTIAQSLCAFEDPGAGTMDLM